MRYSVSKILSHVQIVSRLIRRYGFMTDEEIARASKTDWETFVMWPAGVPNSTQIFHWIDRKEVSA